MATDRRGGPTDWSDKADRYHQAAERALGQLDWAVDYLYSIRKTDIARTLAQNGAFIRRRMADRPET